MSDVLLDPKGFHSQEYTASGAYYNLRGDLNGTALMRQSHFDLTTHAISNMPTKFTAGSVAATAPASGTIWATPISIPQGFTVHSITFCSGTTAGSAMTHQVFGLANSSLVQIVTTADDTSTAWAASSLKTLAVSKVNNVTASAYTVPVTTVEGRAVRHYALFLVAGTTVPTLACQVAGLAAVTATPASGVTDQTSKTAILTDGSVTISVATPNVNVPWVGLA